MPKRLSLRIALLMVIVVPLNFFVFININYLVVRVLGVPDTLLANVVQIGLLVISTPLLLGIFAARYVTRPLRNFVAAINAVQHDRAHAPLAPAGIQEFDQVFAAFNSLTARLATEETLRKNLIGDTSHELNTPLTAMLTQLSAMQDGVLPVTPARIAELQQQTERLIDLVAQLDAYTNARLPEACDRITALRLRDVCTHLEAVFTPLLAQQGMCLQIDVPPQQVVQADRAALEQMLGNLIRNALRYGHGCTITIATTDRSLSVRDDGQGVADDHLPRLFDRFYRVDPSRSRATGGLGLGLAIVRELAERHGWQVHAENARPGLRIMFTLPA